MGYQEVGMKSFERGFRRTVDWSLIVCYLLLVFIGWINIFASIQSAEPSSIFDPAFRSGKQLIWIGISLGVDILILFVINPKWWEALSVPAYLFVLALLVLVIFVSEDTKGSHSWFEFGPVKFQPAEISKITSSLLLAMVMGKQAFKLSRTRDFLVVCAIIGIPMLAIIGESETGSALVYLGYIFVLYREGLSGWWLVILGGFIILFILTLTTSWLVSASFLALVCIVCLIYLLKRRYKNSIRFRKAALRRILLAATAGIAVIFATGFVFNNVFQEHQRSRIKVLLGLEEDPSGIGYNVRQSMIAIGSGGFFGKGFLNGTQTSYGFVPEQSTDFIFCTVGEEWGFVGCFVVLFIYVFFIAKIITDADKCREGFTRIYGYCLSACLFMHLFINVGMTIGLMPVIGIPLPMLSYGGSSLLGFSVMIFIFIALYRRETKYF